ncbi:MAG: TIGR01777 family oxidoreductase [Acidobacteriota bacterium]
MNEKQMKVLITGASGLIGKALQKSFEEKGFEMLLAGRGETQAANEIKWTVDEGFAEPGRLEGLDAVIHLAGENIGGGLRWSDEKKKAIRDSRVLGTRSVVDAISDLKTRPKAFISGSAIGFYGDRGSDELVESSRPGDTFLAEVCRDWEAESRRAEDAGIRTVVVRTGIVLSKDGGALATMLTPFKLGVGGVVGSGEQWMSWIALDDVISIVNYAIENEHLRGAVNAVAPHPVTNREFTKTLGEVLYRPTILPLPEFAVNLVFGEMGDALLLDSTRVIPKRLEEAGFEFKFTELKQALENALK